MSPDFPTPIFLPNKPRPERARIEAAKRVIQQKIFDLSNSEREGAPAAPHRAVNGAIVLVNCGRRTTHSDFQWAVQEMEAHGLLRVRPAKRPSFISVYGENGFAMGNKPQGGYRDGKPILGEDQTPLGLIILETTDRLFAGEIGGAGSPSERPPTPKPERPPTRVSLNYFHSQSVAALEHGLMNYDAITVLPGQRVDVTGYS